MTEPRLAIQMQHCGHGHGRCAFTSLVPRRHRTHCRHQLLQAPPPLIPHTPMQGAPSLPESSDASAKPGTGTGGNGLQHLAVILGSKSPCSLSVREPPPGVIVLF